MAVSGRLLYLEFRQGNGRSIGCIGDLIIRFESSRSGESIAPTFIQIKPPQRPQPDPKDERIIRACFKPKNYKIHSAYSLRPEPMK